MLRFFLQYHLIYLVKSSLAQSSCPVDISRYEESTYKGSDLQKWQPLGKGEFDRNIIVSGDEMQFLFTNDKEKENLEEVFITNSSQFLFQDLTASVTFRVERALDEAIIRFGWKVPDSDWRGTPIGVILGDYQQEVIGGNPVYDLPEGTTSRYFTTLSYDVDKDYYLWPKDQKDITFGADVSQAAARESEVIAHFKTNRGFDIPSSGNTGKPYTLNVALKESSTAITGHSEGAEDSDLISFSFDMSRPNLSLVFGVEGSALDESANMVSILSVRTTGCRLLSEEEKEAAKAEADQQAAAESAAQSAAASLAALQAEETDTSQNVPQPVETSSSIPQTSSSMSRSSSTREEEGPKETSTTTTPLSLQTSLFTSTGTISTSKTIEKKVKTVYDTTLIDGQPSSTHIQSADQPSRAVSTPVFLKSVSGCIELIFVLLYTL